MSRLNNLSLGEVLGGWTLGYYWLLPNGNYGIGTRDTVEAEIDPKENEIVRRNLRALAYLESKKSK